MEDRYDISIDIGEDNSWSVNTLCRIGEDGKYIPVITTDSLSFADSVQRSGYVGVETGELSFSAEIVDVDYYALRELFGLSKEIELLDSQIAYWDLVVSLCNQVKGSKRRKTTYKTIRRDCAKRNRHK